MLCDYSKMRIIMFQLPSCFVSSVSRVGYSSVPTPDDGDLEMCLQGRGQVGPEAQRVAGGVPDSSIFSGLFGNYCMPAATARPWYSSDSGFPFISQHNVIPIANGHVKDIQFLTEDPTIVYMTGLAMFFGLFFVLSGIPVLEVMPPGVAALGVGGVICTAIVVLRSCELWKQNNYPWVE
jgi:hypothetical protein